jgi:SM-20-related protein
MIHSFDVLIDSFLDNKIGIDEAFLSPSLSEGLQANIRSLQLGHLMNDAGIGNSHLKDDHQKMRGDQIYWLDKSHDNIFEQEFLSHVDDLVGCLNETCYAGITGYEFHYAIYGKGTFYKRHKDQFRNDSQRKFSLISYLNDNWLEADGGELLVYHEETEQRIAPRAKTAVFFKSDEMEHEVNTTTCDRLSITGWLKCR